ncbi:MAG: deoxyribonuclease IV [Solirubrobacteraceae bacterium]
MLIGAHISTAGGLAKAIGRGVERGCRSIQIFNQSPRMWRPTAYREEDFVAFAQAMDASQINAVLIHAVYLLNCASQDRDIRDKSRASLTHSLRIGDAIGATGVVLHPGSAAGRVAHGPNEPGRRPSSPQARDGDVRAAVARAGEVIREALADSERCPLHLENTAGAGGTLGRSFEELAELIAAAGGGARIGLCLDSCHLYASGYDIRTVEGLSGTLDECDRITGLRRLGSLHCNDSARGLGSNRDRHANLGEGELGADGCAAFLSEPRFEGLPCVLETPGPDGHGPDGAEVALARRLRGRGKASRTRAR